MVTFDGRAAGREPAQWDRRIADFAPLRLIPGGRTLVVAAHPDDESLGAAGLISRLTGQGYLVEVVIVTDGGGSHPGSPALTRRALTAQRMDESRRAALLLAAELEPVFLGHPDGEVREHRDAVLRDLRVAAGGSPLEGVPPASRIVTTWRGDGHRDHRIVGELCALLADELGAELLEYPIWLWHWGNADDADIPWDRFRSLTLSDREAVVKHRAIAAHLSQIAPIGDDPADSAMLHPRFLQNFDRDVEVYVVAPQPAQGRQEREGSDSSPPEQGLGAPYFDDLYARKADPWGYADRWYEQRKRDVLMATLPHQRLGRVLEIGCSIGVLTRCLARRADSVVAMDVSHVAIDLARQNLTDLTNVDLRVGDLRTTLPRGSFDTIVISEVGYYLAVAELQRFAGTISALLAPGGSLVLCHWRHPVADYPLSGDEVHAIVSDILPIRPMVRHREEDFLLDLFSTDERSVAMRTGLL